VGRPPRRPASDPRRRHPDARVGRLPAVPRAGPDPPNRCPAGRSRHPPARRCRRRASRSRLPPARAGGVPRRNEEPAPPAARPAAAGRASARARVGPEPEAPVVPSVAAPAADPVAARRPWVALELVAPAVVPVAAPAARSAPHRAVVGDAAAAAKSCSPWRCRRTRLRPRPCPRASS
jgi:hypothetical protein